MNTRQRHLCTTADVGLGQQTRRKMREVVYQMLHRKRLERVKKIAGAMLKSDEGNGNEDDASVAPDPAPKDHEELMIKFKAVKDVSSLTTQDLLKNALSASMCLERADRGCIKRSVSDVLKAKFLVRRWLERPNTSETSGKTDNDSEEIVIERDTVVSAHVKVGRGSSSVKVLKQYCVLDIHDKYYNKWFMAKFRRKYLERTPSTN